MKRFWKCGKGTFDAVILTEECYCYLRFRNDNCPPMHRSVAHINRTPIEKQSMLFWSTQRFRPVKGSPSLGLRTHRQSTKEDAVSPLRNGADRSGTECICLCHRIYQSGNSWIYDYMLCSSVDNWELAIHLYFSLFIHHSFYLLFYLLPISLAFLLFPYQW